MFRKLGSALFAVGEKIVGELFGVFELVVLLIASLFSLGDLWRLHKIRSQ